jgi:hypothetical protein
MKPTEPINYKARWLVAKASGRHTSRSQRRLLGYVPFARALSCIRIKLNEACTPVYWKGQQ